MQKFNVKILDQGKSTVKLELEFNHNIWIISKTKESLDQYLKSINVENLSDLNQISEEKIIKNPCFSTLLYFDFFKKMDLLTQTDTYRLLKIKIEQIEVLKSEISIDNNTAKSIINIDIQFKFSQELTSEQSKITNSKQTIVEQINYKKSHKQIKALSKELGLPMKKIKYLDKES